MDIAAVRLRQIEVFHAVYTAGTMTGAAAQLKVSQPSISKVIAHAEQQLGYALFDRVRGKLVATPEAHQLFNHVAAVFKSVDELRHVSQNLRAANTGRIRLGVTPALAADLLPSILASYHAKFPETIFQVETLHHDAISDALTQLRLDIGLAFSPTPNPMISIAKLATGNFVVLGPADATFAKQEQVQITDLAGLPFVALSSGGPLGQLLERHLSESDIALEIVAYCETYHVAKSLVERGLGVTIIDEVTARSPGLGNTRVWPLVPTLSFDIGVMVASDVPQSLVARQFIDHMDSEVSHYLSPQSQDRPRL